MPLWGGANVSEGLIHNLIRTAFVIRHSQLSVAARKSPSDLQQLALDNWPLALGH